MAYFNHAFSKMFLGTGANRAVSPVTSGGLITTAGIPTGSTDNTTNVPVGTIADSLSNLPAGYFGFFDKEYNSINNATVTNPAYKCCPVYIASASVLTNDKIGSFHGGYKETNKSKLINPKYVQAAYSVDSCEPKQAIVSVGATPQTYGVNADTVPEGFQGGTTDATCCYEFLCGETYYLRVDVKGSPALRALNHNAYQTLSAYTGCCPAGAVAPTLVDSTLVFIEWAKALIINNYLKPFILPVVFDETGVAWYAPGTTVDPIDPLLPITSAQWWDAYVSPGHTPDACGGLRLFGAYVGTVFGDCTFQLTDFFEREPVKIYASMVDYNGDPCVFEGICVYNDCLGLQGMGFGDTVLKDFVKAQSYLQNFFHSDFRIREITQGYDMSTAIPRNALYKRYFILHSVPRFNNPTGTFDNDRYMIEIITPAAGNATLDTFLTNWLGACVGCVDFVENPCPECTPVPDVEVIP
jgi:hypothetical protein